MQRQAVFFFLQNTVPFHNYYLKLSSYSHNGIWQIFCKTEVHNVFLLATGHINKMSLRSLYYFPSICTLSSKTAYFSFCPFPLGSCLLRKKANKAATHQPLLAPNMKKNPFSERGGERKRPLNGITFAFFPIGYTHSILVFKVFQINEVM